MELDQASRLRLALLPLISGGTRDRNRSGIEFKTRTYRPTKRVPDRVHVYFDPEDMRTIALLSLSGEFICDGIARDLPLEIALSVDEVQRLFRPSEETKDRTKQARRNLYEILLANAEGRPVTRREASALDEAFANVNRPIARRDALPSEAISDENAPPPGPKGSVGVEPPKGVSEPPLRRTRLKLAPRAFRDED